MNKKQKMQNELSEAVHREATSDDCPTCKMRFLSPLNRDSHRKHYPAHFNGSTQNTGKVEAAAVENLAGTIKHAKKGV